MVLRTAWILLRLPFFLAMPPFRQGAEHTGKNDAAQDAFVQSGRAPYRASAPSAESVSLGVDSIRSLSEEGGGFFGALVKTFLIHEPNGFNYCNS